MLTSAQQAALRTQLEAHHDATIEHHTQLWNASPGMMVSQWTVGRAIRRRGWSYKKNAGRQRAG
jgi:transposase